MGELPKELADYALPAVDGLAGVNLAVVEDDRAIKLLVTMSAEGDGANITGSAGTVADAIKLINAGGFNSLFLDRQFPDGVYAPAEGEDPDPLYEYVQLLRVSAQQRLTQEQQRQIDTGELVPGVQGAPAVVAEGGDIVIEHIIRAGLVGKFAVVAANAGESYDISPLQGADAVRNAASERFRKPFNMKQLLTALGKTMLAHQMASEAGK